jgi:hypothetical protein
MAKSKNDHSWSKNVTDGRLCREVADALRVTYRNTPSAIKQIARLTGISAATARKWYQGTNPPDAAHLLLLMKYYPAVLQRVLMLIGRDDLWGAAIQHGIPLRMHQELSSSHPYYKIWGDTHVTPLYEKSLENRHQINDRQRWFLEMIRVQGRMQHKDIVLHWGVSLRTAKRDTQVLVAVGVIRSVQSHGTGWFELIAQIK